jgi:ubiquinone/menaquinone biosynthesis C-methylase UbiE
MFDEGYQHITNVDISFTVIKQMQDIYREKYPTLTYKQMDVRQMNPSIADETFDAVIDKGTFDSILCGDGSGPNAEQMLNEIHRVLSPNGVYICISYGVKETRMPYFHKKEYDWTVLHHMVAKPTISTSTVVSAESKDEKNFHWVYVMKKQPR